MTRVKRGITHTKRRRSLRKAAKGFQWGRKNTIKAAKTAVTHAGVNAYRGRKQKKRTARRTWQIVISAALAEKNFSYSKFIGALKKQNIDLDRKVLAAIAEENPKVWEKIVSSLQ